ncbi:replication-relaxation family protein [Paenibacillus sp. Marseille-Q4541]|uniref:replication-relaxation family protein n=1 Tax=Paenibacillus sp. Marseille-Q4541 TaxID=2831522 RepID=UPI001BA6A285|nr:replication-relaxation family protein [Paenibacillus sp. Marseille-Q4541]
MRTRDEEIINTIHEFRFLTGEDVAEIYFSHTKKPITQANSVLKRLRRDGYIKCSTERKKYVYYCAERKVKSDSQKIGHFLSISQFYRDVFRIEKPRVFNVEPKLGGKGSPEPDAFMIWKNTPFYVEIQRSKYTKPQMQDKMNRYEKYYLSGDWQNEVWQIPQKKIFPPVWIIGVGSGSYDTNKQSFKVFQDTVESMLTRFNK